MIRARRFFLVFFFFSSFLSLTLTQQYSRFIIVIVHPSPTNLLIPTPAVDSIKMSDAPAAPITEQGEPPATQTEEVPSFKVICYPVSLALHPISISFTQVFIGNLAYSTTDEGLKAFFEPVQNDMYAFSPSCLFRRPRAQHVRNINTNGSCLHCFSISAQVIIRGYRSAGYGFVALSTAEAAQKAVDVLDKQELDGRQVIVEIAKPTDQKENERRDRKFRRRPGRRGSRAVPGEVTEAEANGEAKAEEDAAPAEGEAPKPKKKKKKTAVSFEYIIIWGICHSSQSIYD